MSDPFKDGLMQGLHGPGQQGALPQQPAGLDPNQTQFQASPEYAEAERMQAIEKARDAQAQQGISPAQQAALAAQGLQLVPLQQSMVPQATQPVPSAFVGQSISKAQLDAAMAALSATFPGQAQAAPLPIAAPGTQPFAGAPASDHLALPVLEAAFNQKSAALGTVVSSLLQEMAAMRGEMTALSRQPVGEPRGLRQVAMGPNGQPLQAQPIQRAFVDQFPTGLPGQPDPQGQGQPAQPRLTKTQIKKGFRTLIDSAGLAHESSKDRSTALALDFVGQASSKYELGQGITNTMLGRVVKALQETGQL